MIMIFKCERLLFDYDIQMRKIIIWNANVNKNDFQMRINIKCEWLLFDYVIQMRMISKCECSANDYDIQMIIIRK